MGRALGKMEHWRRAAGESSHPPHYILVRHHSFAETPLELAVPYDYTSVKSPLPHQSRYSLPLTNPPSSLPPAYTQSPNTISRSKKTHTMDRLSRMLAAAQSMGGMGGQQGVCTILWATTTSIAFQLLCGDALFGTR